MPARALVALLALLWAVPAWAQTFPALTGRVVDAAGLLPPADEAALASRLEGLEARTGRQLVVATVPSLEGYDIADYGYRLGRAWGIGARERNDGALLIVAPAERRVRVEVGYGLEGVLTDALTGRIVRERITPAFKAGDYPGGIRAGVDALAAQLELPAEQARANVAAAAREGRERREGPGAGAWIWIVFVLLFFVLPRLSGGGRRRRHRGVPIIFWGGGGGGGWGGGGFGGGGGGFSGGGGSFGGGGSSGSW